MFILISKLFKRTLAITNNPEKQTRFSYPFCPFPVCVFIKIRVSSLRRIVFPSFPTFCQKEGTPLLFLTFLFKTKRNLL